MTNNALPKGWDNERIHRVLTHYETQSEDEAVLEDEEMLDQSGFTLMEIPTDLVPAVRDLIARRRAG